MHSTLSTLLTMPSYLPKKFALGFSGGTDSAYLLAIALQSGCDVMPYCVQSPFQPEFERTDAQLFCQSLGIPLQILTLDLLTHEQIRQNPPNRCYYCKKLIFQTIQTRAKLDGYDIICDGTNASDDITDRPGWQALQELGVLSPLRTAGMTKDEIIRHSTALQLPTAQKPPYACLATRIPHATPITTERLQRIERAETQLRNLGFSNFRIRLFHDAALLQLTPQDIQRVTQNPNLISQTLSPFFSQICLDLSTIR